METNTGDNYVLTPAIDPESVDWKALEQLGITRERLEKSGDLARMLGWQKSSLLSIAIPFESEKIYTDARLSFRSAEDGRPGLSIHPLRKEPRLDFPFMGHTFTEEEKSALRHSGNLGALVVLTPKQGEPFPAYVSVDPQTNEIIALRADCLMIPREIKGLMLTDEQYCDLKSGRPVRAEGLLSRKGKPFNATLQINAEKRGVEFIFDEALSYKQRRAGQRKSISENRKQSARKAGPKL